MLHLPDADATGHLAQALARTAPTPAVVTCTAIWRRQITLARVGCARGRDRRDPQPDLHVVERYLLPQAKPCISISTDRRRR